MAVGGPPLKVPVPTYGPWIVVLVLGLVIGLAGAGMYYDGTKRMTEIHREVAAEQYALKQVQSSVGRAQPTMSLSSIISNLVRARKEWVSFDAMMQGIEQDLNAFPTVEEWARNQGIGQGAGIAGAALVLVGIVGVGATAAQRADSF